MLGIDRVKGLLVRQIRHHVEEATRLQVFPRLDDLSRQIEDVRRATVEVLRVVTDDLDASNEAAALLGRALSGLNEQIDQLRADVIGAAGAPPASDR